MQKKKPYYLLVVRSEDPEGYDTEIYVPFYDFSGTSKSAVMKTARAEFKALSKAHRDPKSDRYLVVSVEEWESDEDCDNDTGSVVYAYNRKFPVDKDFEDHYVL